MAEPMWTLSELAENKKISLVALRSRIKTERCRAANPLPASKQHNEKMNSSHGNCHMFVKRRTGNKKWYVKSELLAWFEAEDAHFKFRRVE